MKFNKKEMILEVSQGLFARFGLLKTTVDEIAKLARIGKGTIYHYFKSKEDIFTEVVEKEGNLLKQKIQDALEAETTPQGKLTAFVKIRFRHLKEFTNYYSALTDDSLEHYGFIEETRRKYLEGEIRTVKRILNGGVMKGDFEIKNTELTAQAIVFTLKGMEYLWTFENDLLDIERSINQFLNILFKGIEKR